MEKSINSHFEYVTERYCKSIDEGDVEGFVGSFCDDGIWERPDGTVVVGREKLLAFFLGRPTNMISRHIPISIEISQYGTDFATGTVFMHVYRSNRAEAIPVRESFPYQVTLIRCDDVYRKIVGEWKIKERKSSIAKFN